MSRGWKIMSHITIQGQDHHGTAVPYYNQRSLLIAHSSMLGCIQVEKACQQCPISTISTSVPLISFSSASTWTLFLNFVGVFDFCTRLWCKAWKGEQAQKNPFEHKVPNRTDPIAHHSKVSDVWENDIVFCSKHQYNSVHHFALIVTP